MNFMRSIIVAGITMFIISCGQENENKAEKETQLAEKEINGNEKFKIKEAALHAVFIHYDKLSSALVAKDAEAARLAANTIAEAAGNLEALEFMLAPSKAIASSSDLKVQREHYSALSNAYIEKIKTSGMESGVLYIDFCPMALNDKGGYWLSTENKVINPYYGDEMLHCGSVVDSVK